MTSCYAEPRFVCKGRRISLPRSNPYQPPLETKPRSRHVRVTNTLGVGGPHWPAAPRRLL